MKNRSLLCLGLIFALSSSIFAQSNETPLFRIQKFGIHVGEDQDRIIGMDHHSLMSSINNPTAMELKDVDFDSRDAYSMICENPHIRLDLSVVPRFAPRSEMRFALVGMFNRIDAVYYQKTHPDGGFQSLDYELNSNEIALEASLLRKFPIGKVVNFYLGGGTNLGYSFNNTVSVYGNNIRLRESGVPDDPTNYTTHDHFFETQSARNSIHQRLFGEVGLGVTIANRVELALHYRFGYGYKWAPESGAASGTNYRSGGLSIRYQLK